MDPLDILLSAAADAALSKIADLASKAFKVEQHIDRWLSGDPIEKAYGLALARAYTAFARQYPDLLTSLFTEPFLLKAAKPELKLLLTRNKKPDATAFARLWVQTPRHRVHSEALVTLTGEPTPLAVQASQDFLNWLEASLKQEDALREIFDTRALEAIAANTDQIMQELARFNRDLDRALNKTLKAVEGYQRAIINTGGGAAVIGDITVSGDFVARDKIVQYHYHYYASSAIRKDVFYVSPRSVYQRLGERPFVGRKWLTEELDKFLNDPRHDRGVFELVAEAGIGKTTFMAHLTRTRGYLHLFGAQFRSPSLGQGAMLSLAVQLVSRYQLDDYNDAATLKEGAANNTEFLYSLIERAADKLVPGEKIVIVCDALDEAGIGPNSNAFGLPDQLPKGVYLVLARRPLPMRPDYASSVSEHHHSRTIARGDDSQQADLYEYLAEAADDPRIARQLSEYNYSKEQFVAQLLKKSGGVWLYAKTAVEDIATGKRAPLELDRLPQGMSGYYEEHWQRWRLDAKRMVQREWTEIYAPLLATLAAMQQPRSLDDITIWSGVRDRAQVRNLLEEHWKAFVAHDKETRTYEVYHASLRDFISADVERLGSKPSTLIHELGEFTMQAHGRIVERLHERCSGDWLKAIPDDYTRQYLVAHLLRAGGKYVDEALQLVIEDDQWAKAREQHDQGYRGYLTDLDQIWNRAEADATWHVGQQIRCALIQSSICTLADNIEPELLETLVRLGMWKLPRALQIVASMSSQSAWSLVSLAPHISPVSWPEALSAARVLGDGGHSAYALSRIVEHLPTELKELKGQVAIEALATVREIGNRQDRADALIGIIEHIPDALKGEALAIACDIEVDYREERARALGGIVKHLPNSLKGEALTALARDMRYPSRDEKDALVGMVEHLPDELKNEAIAIARELYFTDHRARVLGRMIEHLPEALKINTSIEALAEVREIGNEKDRAEILLEMIQHLPEVVKDVAFAVALEIRDDRVFADTLSQMIQHLPQELQDEAFGVMQEITDERIRADTLIGMFERLPEVFKNEAFAVARELSKDFRAYALSGMIEHLPDALRGEVALEALPSALEMEDDRDRALALSWIIEYLPNARKSEVAIEILSAARQIADESERASALTWVIKYLPDTLQRAAAEEALSAARQIAYVRERSNMLIALLQHLPHALRGEVSIQALATVREIEYHDDRAKVLSAMIEYLPDALKGDISIEALAAAKEIKDQDERAKMLSAMIERLPDVHKSEAIMAAKEIESEDTRADVLIAMIEHVPDTLRGKVLAAAQEIESESHRAEALSGIVKYLPKAIGIEVILKELTARREIKDEQARARALSEMVMHLPDAHKPEALAAAREMKDHLCRTVALIWMIEHLPDALKGEVIIEALAEARQIKDDELRGTALSWLIKHLPGTQGSQIAIEAIWAAHQIREERSRGSVLSEIITHLPDELKDEALAAVREIGDERERAHTLRDMIEYLPEGLKVEALATAREITDGEIRANVLRDMIKHLPDTLNNEVAIEVLARARKISDKYERADELSRMIQHMPNALKRETATEALTAAQESSSEEALARTLCEMIKLLPDARKGEALAAASEIRNEGGRGKAISGMIEHLPDALKAAALTSAREITDEEIRAKMLGEMIKHLPEALKEEAFAAAQEIRDERFRHRALSRMIWYLPRALQTQAIPNDFQFIVSRGESWNLCIMAHISAFSGIMEVWQQINFEGAEQPRVRWREALRASTQMTRKCLTLDLVALLPLARFVSHDDVPIEMLRAIRDTARWWP